MAVSHNDSFSADDYYGFCYFHRNQEQNQSVSFVAESFMRCKHKSCWQQEENGTCMYSYLEVSQVLNSLIDIAVGIISRTVPSTVDITFLISITCAIDN